MLIFGSILVFAWFYVYFMIPETKGLSLEDVEFLYSQKIAPWKTPKWVQEHGLTKSIEDRATVKA